MPELKQLRVLRAIAVSGSFSAAAQALDYTQPAVSKIVASLERELGAVLVHRESRPIRLTDAGAALARHADAMTELLATAEAEVRAIAGGDAGSLSLGVFSSAGAAFFVDALRGFRRGHPRVRVSIVEGMPSKLAAEVREGSLDLAIIFDFPDAGEDRTEGLEVHHLLSDPFDVVIPATHPLAERDRIAYADLREEDWLLGLGPGSPTMRVLRQGCAAAGYEPRIAFEVNDCDMTLAMVAAGEGISALPRLMLPSDRPQVRIKPFAAGAPVRRITAIRLPARRMRPAVERFLATLKEAAASHAG